MSNSVSKRVMFVSTVILAVVVLLAGFIAYTLPHWWYRVGEAEQRTEHGPLGTVTVYKSSEGNLLFLIEEDSYRDHYIFYPVDGRIGIPNRGQFGTLPFVSALAYSTDSPVPVVFSDDGIKVETDMNVVLDNNSLEFNTRLGRRVRADLGNF